MVMSQSTLADALTYTVLPDACVLWLTAILCLYHTECISASTLHQNTCAADRWHHPTWCTEPAEC